MRVHQANGEPGKDSYTTWLAITSVAPLWQGFAENTVPAHGCKFILEAELLACCEPALLVSALRLSTRASWVASEVQLLEATLVSMGGPGLLASPSV